MLNLSGPTHEAPHGSGAGSGDEQRHVGGCADAADQAGNTCNGNSSKAGNSCNSGNAAKPAPEATATQQESAAKPHKAKKHAKRHKKESSKPSSEQPK
jgi:hypothetical protein